jgi:hypothetical protein
MHGSFNGIQLRKITSLTTTVEPSGLTLTSFRVMQAPLPDLEKVLQLDTPALLILSSGEIEGRIVQFSANVKFGYEITIELKV